jgi:hypothetical protein
VLSSWSGTRARASLRLTSNTITVPRARARNPFPHPFYLGPTTKPHSQYTTAYSHSRSCALPVADIPPPHTRKSYAPEDIRTYARHIPLPLPRDPLGIGQHGSDTLRARRRQGNCISMPPPTPHCASCCSARQRSPASLCKDAPCVIWSNKADISPRRNRKTVMASHSSLVCPRCRAGESAWKTRTPRY